MSYDRLILQERERKDDEERIRKENIVSGNPLLNSSDAPSGFKVKRRCISYTENMSDFLLLILGGMMTLYLRTALEASKRIQRFAPPSK